jgi:hypothetical protein
VWGQTGPLDGEPVVTGLLPSGRERFVFDVCGSSDWPRSCFIQRGAFAAASPPPASPCGDTDGTESRSAETHLRTLPTRFGSLALGLVDGLCFARLGGYGGEVIRARTDFGGGET